MVLVVHKDIQFGLRLGYSQSRVTQFRNFLITYHHVPHGRIFADVSYTSEAFHQKSSETDTQSSDINPIIRFVIKRGTAWHIHLVAFDPDDAMLLKHIPDLIRYIYTEIPNWTKTSKAN